ncbi:MAG: hypothetical protein L0I79_04190 [Atopostipes sp.]|nr:hypothetical protein [Atopostipes sp.]
MSGKNKKVLLEVDEDCYSIVEEYSHYMNKSEKNVLNQLLDYSLKEHMSKYIDLKEGYQEMGKINLEISRAFIIPENEAFNRRDD